MPCGLPICVSSNAPGAECSSRDSAASSLSALADRPQACLQAVELILAGAHLIGEGAVRMGSLPYTASCLLSSFPHSRSRTHSLPPGCPARTRRIDFCKIPVLPGPSPISYRQRPGRQGHSWPKATAPGPAGRIFSGVCSAHAGSAGPPQAAGQPSGI